MLTTVSAGRVFDYSYCIGMVAMSGTGFWTPMDFALGDGGLVYVVNRGMEGLGARITKCTTEHEFLGQFGGPGTGDGQFVWPSSIDLDHDGNVYVSDDYLHRISIFDKDGQFLAKWGQPGNGDGDFNMPWGICLDHQGDVYVADWKNSRVQKFSPDGTYLATFAGNASGVGEIQRPTGVAVDSEGDVYVTDWSNHRLQIFAPDGTFIVTLTGDAQELSPWGQTYIEASPDVLKARRRVNLEEEWRFRRPVAVNVDAENRIYVLEVNRGRIQVYNKENDFEEAPINL